MTGMEDNEVALGVLIFASLSVGAITVAYDKTLGARCLIEAAVRIGDVLGSATSRRAGGSRPRSASSSPGSVPQTRSRACRHSQRFYDNHSLHSGPGPVGLIFPVAPRAHHYGRGEAHCESALQSRLNAS
ncbi:hypothetical protein EXIGLDRAFT_437382 [Exidia glandulosa HHB12029]|uniref:Uncharacterized protein n=1 Tax=Exidia glandulosa HHB12029 TaxID=1314781 RepID=A0A165B7Y8_EXIGL|nr:hypothetical protein EXIGLDRAFT_437382 [Exidia glandulosa HHB12029]